MDSSDEPNTQLCRTKTQGKIQKALANLHCRHRDFVVSLEIQCHKTRLFFALDRHLNSIEYGERRQI